MDAAAAAATATDREDDNAGCNEDPSLCTSPAAATAMPLSPVVGVMPQQRAGPPLSGVVAYFSSSSDDKDKDEDNNAALMMALLLGRR